MIALVARAMGHVSEVLQRAGPQAIKDMWRSAFPMALAGLVAGLFWTATKDRRGIYAVVTLTVASLSITGLGVWWIVAGL